MFSLIFAKTCGAHFRCPNSMTHHGHASMILVTKLAARASLVNWLSRNVFWKTYNNVCRKMSPKTIVGVLMQHPVRRRALESICRLKRMSYKMCCLNLQIFLEIREIMKQPIRHLQVLFCSKWGTRGKGSALWIGQLSLCDQVPTSNPAWPWCPPCWMCPCLRQVCVKFCEVWHRFLDRFFHNPELSRYSTTLCAAQQMHQKYFQETTRALLSYLDITAFPPKSMLSGRFAGGSAIIQCYLHDMGATPFHWARFRHWKYALKYAHYLFSCK